MLAAAGGSWWLAGEGDDSALALAAPAPLSLGAALAALAPALATPAVVGMADTAVIAVAGPGAAVRGLRSLGLALACGALSAAPGPRERQRRPHRLLAVAAPAACAGLAALARLSGCCPLGSALSVALLGSRGRPGDPLAVSFALGDLAGGALRDLWLLGLLDVPIRPAGWAALPRDGPGDWVHSWTLLAGRALAAHALWALWPVEEDRRLAAWIGWAGNSATEATMVATAAWALSLAGEHEAGRFLSLWWLSLLAR